VMNKVLHASKLVNLEARTQGKSRRQGARQYAGPCSRKSGAAALLKLIIQFEGGFAESLPGRANSRVGAGVI